MMAATQPAIQEKSEAIKRVKAALQEACTLFHETPGMERTISETYGIKLEDVVPWYNAVRIVGSDEIPAKSLRMAVNALHKAGVLATNDVSLSSLIHPDHAVLEEVPSHASKMEDAPSHA